MLLAFCTAVRLSIAIEELVAHFSMCHMILKSDLQFLPEESRYIDTMGERSHDRERRMHTCVRADPCEIVCNG